MRRFSWLSARARRAIASIAGVALAALLLRSLLGGGRELSRATALLAHPHLGWVCVAAGAEVISFLVYATAQRRLLRAAEQRLGVRWLASLAVAAQALNNFMPAGYVLANVLNFRELRRRDVSSGVTGWLLVMSSVLYIGVLALAAMAASLLPGGHAAAVVTDVRVGALALLAGFGALAVAATWFARRGRLACGGAISRVRAQLSEVRLSPRAIAAAAGLFTASWVADAMCLMASFAAVGARPPWQLAPLAYCAAQLVSFLPVTPGGLGLVEGSLALTLTAGGGGGGAHLLAAVLLYRMFSYWATAPGGAFGYLALRRSRASRLSAVSLPSGSLDRRWQPSTASGSS